MKKNENAKLSIEGLEELTHEESVEKNGGRAFHLGTGIIVATIACLLSAC